jgi:hypothetical protein
MKLLFYVTNNKVLLQINQICFSEIPSVKKEGFNSEEAAETIHKEIEEATLLKCQCCKKT